MKRHSVILAALVLCAAVATPLGAASFVINGTGTGIGAPLAAGSSGQIIFDWSAYPYALNITNDTYMIDLTINLTNQDQANNGRFDLGWLQPTPATTYKPFELQPILAGQTIAVTLLGAVNGSVSWAQPLVLSWSSAGIAGGVLTTTFTNTSALAGLFVNSAQLTVYFTPEPSTGVLVASALALCFAGGVRRMRRKHKA